MTRTHVMPARSATAGVVDQCNQPSAINHQPFPSQPGSYVLALHASQAVTIPVGRLGSLAVTPGCFLYVGSALGAGGLAGRLRHHLRVTPRPHWHIDALRAVTELAGVWWCASPMRLEHAWAQALAALPDCKIPLARFGASDCRCAAHLFCYAPAPVDTAVAAALQGQVELDAARVAFTAFR